MAIRSQEQCGAIALKTSYPLLNNSTDTISSEIAPDIPEVLHFLRGLFSLYRADSSFFLHSGEQYLARLILFSEDKKLLQFRYPHISVKDSAFNALGLLARYFNLVSSNAHSSEQYFLRFLENHSPGLRDGNSLLFALAGQRIVLC